VSRATFDALGFVERHGVVLASARGPVPSIAEAVAGGPIKGSWWAHQHGGAIFQALTVVSESAEVKCFKLVGGKVTFVHRRLWPALVRLADTIGAERLAEVRQEHTPSGKHENTITPFPAWVPAPVARAAGKLAEAEARAALGAWIDVAPPRKQKR
jgi:hypothetical protein